MEQEGFLFPGTKGEGTYHFLLCVVGQPPLLWLRSRCVGIWMYFKGRSDPAAWG